MFAEGSSEGCFSVARGADDDEGNWAFTSRALGCVSEWSAECASVEATYHEIVSVPVGNSGRQIEVFERIPGFKVRFTLFVSFGGHSGDFIMHDNEVPRRLGFDDLHKPFFGFLGESFFVDIVGGFAFVFRVGEFAVFDEVTIFDDVGSSRGES